MSYDTRGLFGDKSGLLGLGVFGKGGVVNTGLNNVIDRVEDWPIVGPIVEGVTNIIDDDGDGIDFGDLVNLVTNPGDTVTDIIDEVFRGGANQQGDDGNGCPACPGQDCYSRCQAKDIALQNVCNKLNAQYMAQMKKQGCNTQCYTPLSTKQCS